MADYTAATSPTVSKAYLADVSDVIRDRDLVGAFEGEPVPATDPITISETQHSPVVRNTHEWTAEEDLGPGQHFFEKIHHIPAVIELGNILSTVTQEIEIYNAWRDESKDLTVATVNVDSGVTFSGLPGLPATIPNQSSETFDVVITTLGPPAIEGTLDFTAGGISWSVAVTGNRVVMFAYEPETPIRESLEFLTDIITSASGDEQRIGLRNSPRQKFDMLIRSPEGDDSRRRRMMNLLKGWHAGVFGVPIWWESRQLETDITATDTVIDVDTAYGDFRVGGIVIIWLDDETFDALQVDSFDATSITFTSQVTQDYTAGETLVMPLRTCYISPEVAGERYLQNLVDIRLKVQVIDNESNIGSVSGWDTHNSKVMLDEPNMVEGSTVTENLDRKIEVIDNLTSDPIHTTLWKASAPTTHKGFLGDSLQRVWEVRQLVHALNGSQTSFYLPTFYHDVIFTGTMAASSFLIDIEHMGYTDYIKGQEPFKSLWIELVDGTILTRQVTDYEVIDSTTERLTVDVAWPSLVLPAEVARVSWLRLVRIADDSVSFDHAYPGDAKIGAAIRGVQT